MIVSKPFIATICAEFQRAVIDHPIQLWVGQGTDFGVNLGIAKQFETVLDLALIGMADIL